MLKKIIPLLLILVFTGGVAEAKVYKLLGKPSLGSKVKPVEATSPIPFDKVYRQLTDQQKHIYRGQWEGLGADDIPPFPKKGIQSIYNPLIKGHAKISRGGMLRLVAQIDEKGNVTEVAVYESPHEEITELAMSVMFYAKFKPASCAGKPCKMDFPFEFKLRNRVKDSNTLNSEDIPGISRDN